ncbi:MAG TPA: preprotein translocase subunit YajC [Blastocatellia bacterium]|nr:preprotein translocase subunit YajC [Blastocatellia bacterium]
MNMTTALAYPLFLLQGGQQPGGGSILTLLLPWVLIFGIFYFLVIRPQQRRQKQQQLDRDTLLKALKPGDKVITNGGIYGTIVSVKEKDDTVQLRIAQSVSIEILRSSIAGLQSSDVKDVEAAK